MKLISILVAAIFLAALVFKWSQSDSNRHSNLVPEREESVSMQIKEKPEILENTDNLTTESPNSLEPVIQFSEDLEEKRQELKAIEEKIRDQRIVERLNSGDLSPTDRAYWGEVFRIIALEKTKLLEKEIAETEEKAQLIYENHSKNLEKTKKKFAKARGV